MKQQLQSSQLMRPQLFQKILNKVRNPLPLLMRQNLLPSTQRLVDKMQDKMMNIKQINRQIQLKVLKIIGQTVPQQSQRSQVN